MANSQKQESAIRKHTGLRTARWTVANHDFHLTWEALTDKNNQRIHIMTNTVSALRSLAIAAFASVLLACSSSGPADTAEKFMTHLARAEFTEARQYASQPTGELVEMMGKMGAAMGGKMEDDKDFNFILEEENIDGEKATVRFRKKEGAKIQAVHLVKIDGDWKVHEEKK